MMYPTRHWSLTSRCMIMGRTGLVVLAAIVAAAPATAQQSAKDPQPYIGVVAGDDVYVRSGAAESYYPYAKVNRGDLVRVTGEKFNWSRIVAVGPVFERESFFGYVIYPTTQPGRFRLEPDGKTGVVLGREDVLAPNLNTRYNPSDSWKPLARLDPNTRVTVIETLTDNNRTIQKIKLPANAEGWISSAYIRPATDEEIVAWRRAIGELPESPGDAEELAEGQSPPESTSGALAREESTPPRITTPPQGRDAAPDAAEPPNDPSGEPTDDRPERRPTDQTPDQPAEQPANQLNERPGTQPRSTPSEPTTESAAEPAPRSTSESTPASGDPSRARPNEPASVPLQPITPAGTPADGSAEGDARDDDAETEMPESDAGSDDSDAASSAAKPMASRLEDAMLDDLEQAFEQLRKEPIETAEVEPLRRMYVAFAEQRAENESERRFAMARADQLEIWSDVQARRAEIAVFRQRADRTLERTEAARLASDAAADYAAVGRLAASTIYDGRRLPMMLRVQDPGTGRTVAYVEPNEAFNLIGMIGQLVGIVGERSYDGGLRLNIVVPRRVDLLAPSR